VNEDGAVITCRAHLIAQACEPGFGEGLKQCLAVGEVAARRGVTDSGLAREVAQRPPWCASRRPCTAHSITAATSDDEGVPFREIAEAIGRHLDRPAVSIPPEAAADHFGPLAVFVSLDNPVSSKLTQDLLGWHPAHPGLIDDLGQGHYFQPA
jgi:hypothetical protein